MRRVMAISIACLLSAGAWAGTCTDDFSGTEFNCSDYWSIGAVFGGEEAGSVTITDGVLRFNKTGAEAANTEYLTMVGKYLLAPFAVEYTIMDTSQLVSGAGYLMQRIWGAGGVGVLDWITVSNSGGTIKVHDANNGVDYYTEAAANLTSMRVKFEIAATAITVYVAPNGGAYGAGVERAFAAPIPEDLTVGIHITAMDQYLGETGIVGPFTIDIDDLAITGETVPDSPPVAGDVPALQVPFFAEK